ncbi:septation protein SepH [Bifidobacterium scaligerum]|uniref:DUF3071 domain-containing protein n=1 Tax=Bifidobacterium scaligerum TaxID=2052656 RepID=A0A2M9HTI3_9BIFI|nr:septation protein SepH [Bifidobacterium scaligerum]PJM80098.1 hypothetical protein CUU80_02975 [Bifidobacterium scaligerum]
MPGDRLEKARFERVSKEGDLVFSFGGHELVISVDDTLERAILEAKQVRSETQDINQVHQQSTLPISQIQALIRAGASPARVAEKYHISETLVRRFSAAVETEKQYAIEQFLTVAAPKDSKVRTISELVERTLASAGIGMESVTWKSTRRGLEPWRIVAIFTSAGREIHAEWTWNMHDNAVMSLNNAARMLLGEQHAASGSGAGKPSLPELPGDSVRSARIERTVSAWAMPTPSASASRSGDSPAIISTGSMPPIDISSSGSIPPIGTTTSSAASLTSSYGSSAVAPDHAGETAAAANSSGVPSAGSENTDQAAGVPAVAPSDAISDKTVRQGPNAQLVATEQDRVHEDSKPAQDTPAKPARRRSGRSAVPSWDEILFGD